MHLLQISAYDATSMMKTSGTHDALLDTRSDLAHGYTLTGGVNLGYEFEGRLGCGFICRQNNEASLCALHCHMHQRTLLGVILASLLQLQDKACLQHKEAHKERASDCQARMKTQQHLQNAYTVTRKLFRLVQLLVERLRMDGQVSHLLEQACEYSMVYCTMTASLPQPSTWEHRVVWVGANNALLQQSRSRCDKGVQHPL